MTPPPFTPAMISALLPELLLLALAGLVLLVDLFLRPWRSPPRTPGPRSSPGSGGQRGLGYLTAVGLTAILVLVLIYGRPGGPPLVFGGVMGFDPASRPLSAVFLLSR